MRSIVFAGLFALSSCAPTNTNSVNSRAAVDVPAVKVFATPRPRRPVRSNREIARDFMDLTFRLESGRTVPVFTRFEVPIEVRLSGDDLPATITRDLETLLRRLRNEAGIPISRTDTDNAQINIEIIPARQLKSLCRMLRVLWCRALRRGTPIKRRAAVTPLIGRNYRPVRALRSFGHQAPAPKKCATVCMKKWPKVLAR